MSGLQPPADSGPSEVQAGKKQRIKREQEDDGVELMKSLKDEAEDATASAHDTKSRNQPGSDSGQPGQAVSLQDSQAHKESGKQTDNKGKSSGDQGLATGPTIQKSVETDDEEPELLAQEDGTSSLFPDAPCETVAKRCKKGNDDPAPLYLNRYGPRSKPWFVWSTDLVLPKNSSKTAKDLQNVSEKFERVLDYPRKQGEAKPRASNVLGILNLVWDCSGMEHDPEAAAELLNPSKVKNADQLSTPKARREFLAVTDDKRRRINKLDKYPTTHVDVKYRDSVHELFGKRENTSQGAITSRWEVGSCYRALYRKDELKAERKVYDAAVHQAKRFMEWYKSIRPEDFDETGKYRRSTSRDPTVQPFRATSSTPSPQSPTPDRSTVAEKTPTPAPVQESAPPPRTSPAGQERTPAPQPTSERASPPQASQSSDDKLSRDEFQDVVLEAYTMRHNIDSSDNMNPKQRAKWNAFFNAYAKMNGY